MTTKEQGSWVERKAWILLAFMAVVLIAFGLMAYFSPVEEMASTPIQGSACCTGQVIAEESPWVTDYLAEMGKYMGTFMVGMGILALTVVVVPFRRHERWAWTALLVMPILFAVHGFALGSFPFDIVPLVLTLLGLAIPAKRFWSNDLRVGAATTSTA